MFPLALWPPPKIITQNISLFFALKYSWSNSVLSRIVLCTISAGRVGGAAQSNPTKQCGREDLNILYIASQSNPHIQPSVCFFCSLSYIQYNVVFHHLVKISLFLFHWQSTLNLHLELNGTFFHVEFNNFPLNRGRVSSIRCRYLLQALQQTWERFFAATGLDLTFTNLSDNRSIIQFLTESQHK